MCQSRIRIEMKKLFFIVLFLCQLHFATTQGIDTLWKNNPGISDSAKLELLGDLCYNLVFEDTAKSVLICEEMLRFAEGASNIYARINAYRTAGIIYQELQNFTKTLINYSMAVKLCAGVNDTEGRILYGKTLSNFGSFYHRNGDYETALLMYLRADSLLDPFDFVNFKINIYSKISDVYDHLRQKDQYTYYYNKLLKLAEKAKDTLSIISSQFTLALREIDEGEYDAAEAKFKNAMKLAGNLRNPECIFICHYNLGLIEKLRKNDTKAIEYFIKSTGIARKSNDYYNICESLNKLGSLYLKTGNFKEAQNTIEESISLSRQYEFSGILKDALGIAVNIQDTLGNYRKALIYYKEYDKLLKKITDLEVRKNISFLDAKYQAGMRENEIGRLEAQQKIQSIKISRNRLWIISLVALTLLLTGSFILIFLNLKYKKQIIKQENDIQRQIIIDLEKDRQLTATTAVLQGEEAERTRLARDLHDGLGGLLSGIKLKLTGIKGNFIVTQDNVDQFDKALNLLDYSIGELRRVAHNMMPEALIKYGLKDALSDFCSQLQCDDKLKVVFQFYGQENRMDNTIEIGLFRIAQELLNNVIKHAGASEAIVQLIQEDKRVHLVVQDNGKGFDPSGIDPMKGTGLSNIKARVFSLNGRVDIDSKPGQGTEISVEL
jgi:two-component system, NarL family, sensor kinase